MYYPFPSKRLIGATLVVALLSCAVSGQVQVQPASSSCECDGTLTWVSGLVPPVNYQVITSGGGVFAASTSASGIIALTGLCPSAFAISGTGSNGTQSSVVVNIPTMGFNPGDASTITVCSNAPPVNLNQQLSNFQSGGIWSGPAGQPDNGFYNALTESPGLYAYAHQVDGCPVSTGIWVEEITNSNAGLSTTYLICDNYAPFFMTSVLTGNPQSNGTWHLPGGPPIDGWFNPATMNTGIFTYVVPGVAGCEDVISTLYVIENQVPNPGVNTSILVCTGSGPFSLLAQLNGNPNPGGTWYTMSNQPIDDLFDPAVQPAGTYRYRLQGQTPCTDQEALLTIGYTSVNPSGADGSLQVCQDGPPVNLINSVGGSPISGGIWTGPGGVPFSGQFNPQVHTPGNYQYFYPNVGCDPSASTVQVSVFPQPVAGQNQSHSFCTLQPEINLDALLSAEASVGGNWTVNGLSTGSLWSHPGPGTYQAQYSVGGGICPPSVSVQQITIDPLTAAVPDVSDYVCVNSSDINLSSYYTQFNGLVFSSGGNQVSQWSPAANSTGQFTVTLPSTTSCPASTAQLTLIPEIPAFQSTSVTTSVCESDGWFNLNENGFATDYQNGIWTRNGLPVSSIQTINFSGDAEYVFTSNPGLSCAPSQLQLTVTIIESPYAGDDSQLTLCSSDPPVTLASQLSSGSGAGQWFLNSNPYSSTVFDPANSNGIVLHYVVDAQGDCPSDVSVHTLQVIPQPSVSLGAPVALCAGSSPVTISAVMIPGYSYYWSCALPVNQTNDFQIEAIIPQEVSATQNFPVNLAISNGICQASDMVAITVNPLPSPVVTGIHQLCEGESTTLSAVGGTNHIWNFSDGSTALGSVQQIAPVESMSYQVTAFSSFGCSRNTGGEIIVSPLPVADLQLEPVSGCAPFTHEFGIGPDSQNIASVSWWINGTWVGSGNSISHTIYNPGTYDAEVVLTSAAGCTVSFEMESFIEVLGTTVADFSIWPETVSVMSPEVQLTDLSTNASQYFWTLSGIPFSAEDSPALVLPSESAGLYEICLRTISTQGCPDSICRYISVTDEFAFFAPNAFTPDQDGVNEAFRPYFFGYDEHSYHCRIFNRWGILLFESTDPQEAWTGNVFRGNHFAPNDVYSWVVELKRKGSAETERFNGHVTLIR